MANLSKSLMGLLAAIVVATAVVTFVLSRDSDIERVARAAQIQAQTSSTAATEAAKLSDLIAANSLTLAVEQAAFLARVFAAQVWYIGQALLLVALGLVVIGGVGLLILRESLLIRPTASGQMPMMNLKGPGWQTLVDPNRMPGPFATLRTPTIIDYLIWVWRTMRGQETQPLVPVVETPIAVSEPAAVALAQQATMAAISAGATRHAGALEGGKALSGLFTTVGSQPLTVEPVATAALPAAAPAERPTFEVMRASHVQRLLDTL